MNINSWKDFHRNEKGELVHNPNFRQTKKLYEVSRNKRWNAEERSFLYDAVNNGEFNYGRLSSAFTAQGFTGLRKVHVDLVKRYVQYGARDAYISGKDLTTAKGV